MSISSAIAFSILFIKYTYIRIMLGKYCFAKISIANFSASNKLSYSCIAQVA